MTLPRHWPSAVGLAVGYLADRVFGDPERAHPVAAFGAAASWLESRCYSDRQTAGLLHTGALVGTAIGLGAALERLISHRSWATVITTAAATWAVLGGRSLSREAATVAGQLADGRLVAARGQVRHLVGRDTAELSPEEVARATVESVAENASDAIVAPLLWGAVAGLPGMLGYRAINTLDAMIGHRSSRYRRFGWAAARLDDLANWVPARLAALAAAAWAPLVGGTAGNAMAVVRSDAGQHPSPNAGVVEAAFAGALDVRLGGQNAYHGAVEDRGLLGNGRPVAVADIARASRLAAAVSMSALAVAVLVRGLRP
ncbi:MAG TPA: cobalamin biosynthesis protein [Propionibacteriaceae bacterium]|jgi:adenosylcobinamide-phosphate synthase|nr:cobalamin biosynthesis protein [Propionibacteriaceae bacterium]